MVSRTLDAVAATTPPSPVCQLNQLVDQVDDGGFFDYSNKGRILQPMQCVCVCVCMFVLELILLLYYHHNYSILFDGMQTICI